MKPLIRDGISIAQTASGLIKIKFPDNREASLLSNGRRLSWDTFDGFLRAAHRPEGSKGKVFGKVERYAENVTEGIREARR